VVVFDGWKGGSGRESRTVTGGITVIYSALGERADDVIKRIIAGKQKKWVVVSSDRAIEKAAWEASSVPIESGAFHDALARALAKHRKRAHAEEAWYPDKEEEEEEERFRKGNPRRLSKKQREIRRVLDKLQ